MRIAAGESVAAVAAAPVASMTTGTLKAMMFYKMKGTTIAILVCGSARDRCRDAGTPASRGPGRTAEGARSAEARRSVHADLVVDAGDPSNLT